MKIVRERPCQNRYHEVTAPLIVKLPSGAQYYAKRWSLGGLCLEGVRDPIPDLGTKIPLQLQLPFQGFDISFDIDSTVVQSSDEGGEMKVEFEELSERAHDLMVHFLDDLVRGKMATIDDTICRIDVPVTPISTKPDPKPDVESDGRKWPIKSIVMSSFYTVFGIVVFGYLGVLIYANVMRIEVRSAVVSAPVATIRMPVDGVIKPVRYERGMVVEAGDTIAVIESPTLSTKIEDMRIELEAARRSERRAQEKFRIEQNRMKLYRVISRTDLKIAQAQVSSARTALAAADTAVERLKTLFEKQLVSVSKFDLARKEQNLAEKRLKRAEYELERRVAMDMASSRRYYNHKEFVSDLDMLSLEVTEASERVAIATMQLAKFERLQSVMTIKAPYDGKIVAVMQAANTNVLRNASLFSIEESREMTVTAFVDQDQVLGIGLDDTAKVYLPSLGVHAIATVVKVDRNSAFLNADRSHYSWEDGKEKNAAISLQLELQPEQRLKISAGLPAVVIFPKRSVSDIYARVVNFFNSSPRTDNASIPI